MPLFLAVKMFVKNSAHDAMCIRHWQKVQVIWKISCKTNCTCIFSRKNLITTKGSFIAATALPASIAGMRDVMAGMWLEQQFFDVLAGDWCFYCDAIFADIDWEIHILVCNWHGQYQQAEWRQTSPNKLLTLMPLYHIRKNILWFEFNSIHSRIKANHQLSSSFELHARHHAMCKIKSSQPIRHSGGVVIA